MKKSILIIILSLSTAFAFCQTKKPDTVKPPLIEPVKTLVLPATTVDIVYAKLDSVAATISRSDMRAPERNWATDKLAEVKIYLLQTFFKQNPPKQDSTKTK